MTDSPSKTGLFGAALTFGFGTAVAMWCVWWVAHVPAVSAPAAVTGPILLATMLAGMGMAGRAVGPGRAWRVGMGAGLIAAALDLLVVLGFVAKPPSDGYAPAPGFEGLTTDSILAVLGFMALGGISGVLGGTIGATLGGRSVQIHARSGWLPWFAWVACVATIPLLIVGGAVTSTASGMAVPGWPDTYGANMFLYPIKFMSQPRIFLEHTHRLFGTLVGLTTLSLMVWVLVAPVRRSLKAWAVGAFLLVCVQGVLGGLRVNASSAMLGLVHGVIAQLFLAVLVCIATSLSPVYDLAAAAPLSPGDRKRRALCMGLQHATIVQLLFGAAYRHMGQAKGGMHALWTHAGFSLVVVGLAIAAGSLLRSRGPASGGLNSAQRRIGTAILGVVTLQFLLGVAAFIGTLITGPRGAPPTADQLHAAASVPAGWAIVATLHQANGALLLGLATAGVVITRRVWRNDRDQARAV